MLSLQLFDLWCALQIPLHLRKKKKNVYCIENTFRSMCLFLLKKKKKRKQESKQGEDIWVMRIGLKNAGLFPE